MSADTVFQLQRRDAYLRPQRLAQLLIDSFSGVAGHALWHRRGTLYI